MDSKLACGMTVGAFMWISHCKSVAKQIPCTFNGLLMKTASSVPDSTRSSIHSDDKPRKNVWQAKHISESEIVMVVDLYTLGVTGRWALIPFRASDPSCGPAAIIQIRKASLAAARVTRWRQWFEALDEAQQKAHVQNLSETGNDISWAGLWLECGERSKPEHPRLIATAVRAVAILGLKKARVLRKIEEEVLRTRKQRYAEVNQSQEASGLGGLTAAPAGPSSAPLTPHDIKVLNIRLAPSYFRLPANAFRFATQLFSGKSYEEAVKEQKANFNSWVKEATVCRVVARSSLVVSDDVVGPKDRVWKFDF